MASQPDSYCIICGERKVYCRCNPDHTVPTTRSRITTEQDARDFIADMIITFAEKGPEAANSMMLALGRSELQVAFTVMFARHLQLALREERRNREENSKE